MKTLWLRVLLVGLFVAALALGAGVTYFGFPQSIVEEVPQTTITWAMGHGYHYSVAVVMQHLELLEKYSGDKATLEIEILKGPAVSEVLISGAAQFGQRSAPAVLKDIDNGAPFKMLLSVGKMDHELWVSDPNVQAIADLTEDHSVAVVAPNSIEEIGLGLGLQRLGRSLDSVTVAHLKHDVAYQAMLTGELDGDYTGAPYPARYAAEPDKFHLIATDTDLYQMMLPASVVYAQSDYIAASPDVTAYVVAAWLEAISWINANPEEAARVTAAFYEDPLDSAYKDWQESNIVFAPTMGLSSVSPLSKMLSDAGVLTRAYTDEELLFFASLGEDLR